MTELVGGHMTIDIEPVITSQRRESRPPGRGPRSLCMRITGRARSHPERLAVADADGALTYAELDRRADALAARLLELGAGPESCVAILLERSSRFVVAALAVLKTGAGYLPLDVSAPGIRTATILSDARVSLLVTDPGRAGVCPPGCRVVDPDGPGAPPAGVIPRDGDPRGLAYVVYTSGTSGRPKGVEITHANLANLLDWHVGTFDVVPADRAAQIAGLGFDAAVWEIWPSLVAGASLHLADEPTRRSPHALRDWLLRERITIAFAPTALAEQLMHLPWPADTALRTLLTGADTLHGRPPAGLPFDVVNNYGPTECTVVATSGAVAHSHRGSGSHGAIPSRPSIGRPIADTRAHVLDPQLRPVPVGSPGELCLSGSLVGRGYRHDPELTARAFVTLPEVAGGPVRAYRTGDRVRVLPDGELEFLGRLDDQVKIRGHRVEPDEVTGWLTRHPWVAAGVTVAHQGNGPDADPELVSYVVPAPGVGWDAGELHGYLTETVPAYMVPTHLVRIEALPLTPNGKIDRARLPRPTTPVATSIGVDGGGACGVSADGAGAEDAQTRLCVILAELLNRPTVAPDANFFMLGGHSMLGVQLRARIHQDLGVQLELRELFGAPTAVALGELVGAARRSADVTE